MKKLKRITKVKLLFPSKEQTGDNSLMIGIAGYINVTQNPEVLKNQANIKANGNLRLSGQ